MHKKVANYERKSPESGDSGDFWWRLLDSNQWPHACEDSIGTPSAGFRENKADLSQNSITRRYALFRCFRPVFSTRGSGRGSMSITLTVHHKRPFYFHNTRSSSQSQLPKMLQRLFASHAHPHQNAGYEPDILFPACH